MDRRVRRLAIALALIGAACGGTVGGPTVTGPMATGSPSSAGSESVAPSTPGSTVPVGPTTTTSQNAVAPDFTLQLGEGGTFTLSEAGKPVYLVFWAEW